VFSTLFTRVVRLTAFVDVNNQRAMRNAVSMGFVYEGFCRKGINGNRDAYTFGMLKEDCRMLRPVGGRKRVQGLQDRRVSSHG
jgi:RimJ/RimL family protein N-acetyltransferase